MRSYFIDTLDEIYQENKDFKLITHDAKDIFTSCYHNMIENSASPTFKHTNYIFFADNDYHKRNKCIVKTFFDPFDLLR